MDFEILVFAVIYTVIWFFAGWIIGQNVVYAKMEKKEESQIDVIVARAMKTVRAVRKDREAREAE